jgi:hypothetical protein
MTMTDEPTHEPITQVAPWPHELADIVANLAYRPGWSFRLDHLDRGQGSEGMTFRILSRGYDTYNPDRGENYQVWHYFIVPAASYNRRSWLRWVLDRLIDVETHEACEFMVVAGERPFAPNHGRAMTRTTPRVEHRRGRRDVVPRRADEGSQDG